MGKKPSYEELEHKVKELEEAISERKRSEKEAQAQAEWIRVLFSSIKDAIFVHPFKEEGFALFTEVNDTACKRYGYSRDEFLHLSAPNITQKPDANAHSKYSHRSKLLEKGHLVFETVHIKKSGETFPVEINSNIVYQLGKPFILSVVRDITERKQAEMELRESEERYRLLADNVTDVIWVRDMNLKVTYMSPSVMEQQGYTVEEAKDRTLEETLTPDSYKHALEAFAEELEAEKSKQKDMSRSRTIDVEINCKDGSTIWSEIKMSFLRNQNGDPIGIIGITRNITERKRAEEELQKLASVIKYSSELVNLATIDGKMIFLNEAGMKMLGIDSDEVKRIHIMEVIPNHMKELVQNELLPALMQGNTWEGELQYRNIKTGDLTDVLARTFTVSKPNTKEPLFLANVSMDITDRKRAEEEKKKLEAQLHQALKMEAIGTLAGGIAHDFNNILYSIIGYTELAMDEIPEDSKVQQNLKEAYKGAMRAKDMVQQILAFSRKADTQKRPIKIQSVIKEALKLLRSSIPSTIEICQNIDKDCEPVFADSTQIHQMVMNIATNAYQAMRGNGGVLNLTLVKEDISSVDSEFYPDLHPGKYLRLTMSDNGQGIDKGIIEKIFDPYFTTKGPGEGTGMGLAMVHGIVKDHGGNIMVQSELGKGTTFHIHLPIIKTRSLETETKTTEMITRGSERILFVDDEELITLMVRQILEHFGYQVTSRTSSVEALEAFRAKPNEYDLVITDMTMPNMTGIELTSRLKEIRYDIPVIICTGFSEMIDEYKAKYMGISGYLMKPILKDELAGAVRKVLDGKKRE